MGNAAKELKAIANEVTLSNDEDGIAYILNKYI
jgi:hydroxymethylpyrimidine pyrophosphatase-like HAD family hydrolase